MKKIMFFISAALFFTFSCTDFPDETQIVFKAGPDVEITTHDFENNPLEIVYKKYLKYLESGELAEEFETVKLSPDYAIAFKLKTNDNAVFFSYLIREEDAPSDLDPLNVLRGTYSNVAYGTFKYGTNDLVNETANNIGVVTADIRYQFKEYFVKDVEGKDSIHVYDFDILPKVDTTIVFAEVKPDMVYQIYAVSGHKDGGVSVLSNKNVTTTDFPPRYVSRSIEDRIISVNFSEPIKRDDENKGNIFVTYYYESPAYATFAGEFIVDDDSITSSGNTLKIELSEDFPAGAHVCITWEEGAVTDRFGTIVSEFTTKGFQGGQTGGWQGCYVRVPVEPWNFDDPDDDAEVEEFDNYNTFRIILTHDAKYPTIARINADYEATVTYKIGGRTVTLPIPRNNCAVNSDGNVSITLPQNEKPDKNAMVTINIGKDSFIDRFGNGNDDFKLEDMFKYVGD